MLQGQLIIRSTPIFLVQYHISRASFHTINISCFSIARYFDTFFLNFIDYKLGWVHPQRNWTFTGSHHFPCAFPTRTLTLTGSEPVHIFTNQHHFTNQHFFSPSKWSSKCIIFVQPSTFAFSLKKNKLKSKSSDVPPSPSDPNAQSKTLSDPPKKATFKEIAAKVTTYLINPPSKLFLFFLPTIATFFPFLLQGARTKVHDVAHAQPPTQLKGKGSGSKKMLFLDETKPKVPRFPVP